MSQQENNTTAPQGSISMAITAPSFAGKTKRENVQMFADGPQPAVIYAVVGLGSHMKSFKGEEPKEKDQIFIGLEFPQLKQLFYEEDTEPRSTTMSIDSTFNMGERSKLRLVAEAVIGRKFRDNNEANNFDISKLIGAKILVGVATKVSQKTGKPYNYVGSLMAIGDYPIPPNFNPELEYQLFAIDPAGNNFRTMNYANLPYWLKKTILESKEAKAYAAKGGLFAKKTETTNTGQAAQQNANAIATPTQSAPPPQGATKKFVMIDTTYTLEQWKQAQWTEQQLVDAGKARWEMPEPIAPPSAPPSAPPAAPSAPAGPPQPNSGIIPAQAAPPTMPDSGIPVAGQLDATTSLWDEDEDDLPY